MTALPEVVCTLIEIGRRSPTIDLARLSHSFDRSGSDLDALVQSRGLQLLLHRRHRHDALVGVAQVQTSLLGLYGPRLEQKNACDDLKTVGDAMLHLLEQNSLLSQQLVFFPVGIAALRYVFYRQ